jgi:acetylornithine deacetylase
VSTSPTEVAFLRDLIAIPSISGNELPAAEMVELAARELGLDVVRDETSVRITTGCGGGRTIVLASHLDVVPPGEGWTRGPFTPVIEGDLLYGRGSGDAKASVSAMFWAIADLAERGTIDGRAMAVFTYGEETRHATMPEAVQRIGPVDAAIVGEPTNLQAAIAQRGLMMVDLVAHGDQRHAGYASTGDFTNAISVLAREILKLDGIVAERVHPVLGVTTVTPTMLEGGVSRNVTPPSARAVLDIRSTPAWTHDELDAALRERLACDVHVTSKRLVPCETPPGSRLLEAVRRVDPDVLTYGSPTCSDWCFLRHVDAVKLGPGTSQRSHTADESVNISEVTAARGLYARIVEAYLA